MKQLSISPGNSRPFPLWIGVLSFSLIPLFSGCGFRSADQPAAISSPLSTNHETGSKLTTPKSGRRSPEISPPVKTPKEKQFETARKKEIEITGQLEQADKMMKGANLEGALRVVQRLDQENSSDPYVKMRTSYMQAMIFNRMKDANRRKEAMNQLLKSMEALQNDPRFQESFIDGQANQEMIKMSLEKAGKKYGN